MLPIKIHVAMSSPKPILPEDFIHGEWRKKYDPELRRAEDSRTLNLWHRDMVVVSQSQTLCLGEFIKGLAINRFTIEQTLLLLKGLRKTRTEPDFSMPLLQKFAFDYGVCFWNGAAPRGRTHVERRLNKLPVTPYIKPNP